MTLQSTRSFFLIALQYSLTLCTSIIFLPTLRCIQIWRPFSPLSPLPVYSLNAATRRVASAIPTRRSFFPAFTLARSFGCARTTLRTDPKVASSASATASETPGTP